MPEPLNLLDYVEVVRDFCSWLERTPHTKLKGVTDGKATGTYIEQNCRQFIEQSGKVPSGGNSALGIDLPQFQTDVKATLLTQPQSSSPFKSIEEKIFGLPYNILLIVYTKKDLEDGAHIELHRVSYIPRERTADHRTSALSILLAERLKRSEMSRDQVRRELAEHLGLPSDGQIQITDAMIDRLAANPPQEGVITITFALQWRLNYNFFKGRERVVGVTDIV